MVYRIRYNNENTNMTTLKAINKFVDTFFTENNLETAKTMWSSDATQKALKTVLNKAEKGTREKDPNAPKRGKSAYLYFCEDKRDEVRKTLGADAKAADVTRKLGELWNKLKSQDKTGEYDKLAEVDKERYYSEKEAMAAGTDAEPAVKETSAPAKKAVPAKKPTPAKAGKAPVKKAPAKKPAPAKKATK